MGCVQSVPVVDKAKARNDEIESQLQRDGWTAKNEVKMLFLEAGEPGKSAFLKRMKLSRNGGYSNSERDSYKEIIFSHTIHTMCAILDAIPHLDLALSPQNEINCVTIFSLPDPIEADVLPRNVADALSSLWRDPAVQEAVQRSREFQVNDSAVYYFNAIGRMASPSYLPTDQDILRSPSKTSGITETAFKVGELTYKLVDVGGQRGERKKWIHCFENVTAVVFVVSLSDYDQMLYEDESINRMHDTLTVFDSICNSQWFTNKPIILIFDEMDLFAEKLSRSPLKLHFPNYDGGADVYAACDYLLHRFVNLIQNSRTKRIYAVYTRSTDTRHFKHMSNAIQEILIQQKLRNCRLLWE